jgi:hypothetical protein
MNRVLLATTGTTSVLLSLTNGVYQISATAVNIVGLESDLSIPLYIVVSGTNVVAVSGKPGAPINIQLR